MCLKVWRGLYKAVLSQLYTRYTQALSLPHIALTFEEKFLEFRLAQGSRKVKISTCDFFPPGFLLAATNTCFPGSSPWPVSQLLQHCGAYTGAVLWDCKTDPVLLHTIRESSALRGFPCTRSNVRCTSGWELETSVWRIPKSDTFFYTNIFRDRYRYHFNIIKKFQSRYRYIKKWKSFETEKFQNRSVTFVGNQTALFALSTCALRLEGRWWTKKQKKNNIEISLFLWSCSRTCSARISLISVQQIQGRRLRR